MALTKSQQRILRNANARLERILDKAAANEPALLYSPAVDAALSDLGGRTKFTAADLKAAKSFNRKKSSTVAGARKWAAQQGLQAPPPRKSSALTPTQTREISAANKRLAAMRKRGEEIPERYKGIERFRKDTAALAHEFINNPKTVKRPRKAYKQLPAKLGARVKKLAEAYRTKQMGDAFYEARRNGDIDESVSFKEFSQRATPPQFTGDDLARWAKKNAPHVYEEINQTTGRGAQNVGDYWNIIRGLNF